MRVIDNSDYELIPLARGTFSEYCKIHHLGDDWYVGLTEDERMQHRKNWENFVFTKYATKPIELGRSFEVYDERKFFLLMLTHMEA